MCSFLHNPGMDFPSLPSSCPTLRYHFHPEFPGSCSVQNLYQGQSQEVSGNTAISLELMVKAASRVEGCLRAIPTLQVTAVLKGVQAGEALSHE